MRATASRIGGLLAAVCLIVMLFSAKTFAQDGVHSEVDITS
jgi:hypothetical protein